MMSEILGLLTPLKPLPIICTYVMLSAFWPPPLILHSWMMVSHKELNEVVYLLHSRPCSGWRWSPRMCRPPWGRAPCPPGPWPWSAPALRCSCCPSPVLPATAKPETMDDLEHDNSFAQGCTSGHEYMHVTINWLIPLFTLSLLSSTKLWMCKTSRANQYLVYVFIADGQIIFNNVVIISTGNATLAMTL